MKNISRRRFVQSAATVGAFSILPSGLRANSPNGRLAYALVGCGGNGGGTTSNMMSHAKVQVVGLCDPDKNKVQAMQKRVSGKAPDVQTFADYRELLGNLGDKLDAIAVSTPDHNHHPVTLAAMKQGVHVYTQKPLTHRISDARELKKVADETGSEPHGDSASLKCR